MVSVHTVHTWWCIHFGCAKSTQFRGYCLHLTGHSGAKCGLYVAIWHAIWYDVNGGCVSNPCGPARIQVRMHCVWPSPVVHNGLGQFVASKGQPFEGLGEEAVGPVFCL